MSDWLLEPYEEYLIDFEAWGQEFFTQPLTFDEYVLLSIELEDIDLAEECSHITPAQKRRREEIDRLMLTHESYFADGPRTVVRFEPKEE